MDVRHSIGASRARPAPAEIHSDSPELSLPLSAEQVYHDYAPRVFNTARRMVHSDVDAEDVTQDVLLQVVRKLPSFRGDAAFPTWLHRVTVNTALTHRRRQASRQQHSLVGSFDATDEAPQDGGRRVDAPDDQALDRERRQLIDRAIDELPPEYRAVFVLADVEGLPNAEIGQRLGLSLPAVKSRLHRARGMMRQALAPHFAEPRT
ncbi:MAG: sigma-70 family RNA polymerase sigma factor [Gemmataceae bacterium]